MSKILNTKRNIADFFFSIMVNIAALFSISIIFFLSCYMIISSFPAFTSLGLKNIFSLFWHPTNGEFGVLAMVFCTIIASFIAVFITFPIALFTASFSKFIASKSLSHFIITLAKVCAGLPSVLFGLVCMIYLLPLISFFCSPATAYNGGATLLATICVLAVCILPQMIISLFGALNSLDHSLIANSYALGANGSDTAFMLGFKAIRTLSAKTINIAISKSFGEATAVLLVSGNVSNMPYLFNSVRLLSSTMILEMGYAVDVHRSALYLCGLLLLAMSFLVSIIIKLFE